MTVRNKKKIHSNRQKLEKAQHQKQFVNEMKDLIAKAAGPDVVHIVPEYEIERLYKIRCHTVRLKAAPGEIIPPHILRFSNHLVTLFFKNASVEIGLGTLEQLSLYTFFSTGYTLITYAEAMKEDAYANASAIKKALAPLAALFDSDILRAALSQYNSIMVTISLLCSDFNDHIYAFKFNPDIVAKGVDKAGFFSEVYRTRLPKIKMLIEEHNRPLLQVGWYLPEPALRLEFINVQSEEIYQPPGSKLDVYIQSHAINRLAERLDGIDTGILHFNIFNSFTSLKVCRNKSGLLLFEYAIFGDKAGYFLGELIHGKIILKTFLFLTHKGTPEADKLQAITGLVKEDIIYLDIDKLSTFMLSDIASNERVKQLFVDAGCESLFKIDKELYFSSEGISAISKAESIEKYLQLNTWPMPGRLNR
jgi:hypothetical protein